MDRNAPLIARFLRDQRGATAIEYGLLAGLSATGIIIWAGQMGVSINAVLLAVVPALNR